MNNKSLIIGSSGLVGSSLMEKLDPCTRIGLTRKKFGKFTNLRYFDFNQDLEDVINPDEKISTVYHLGHDYSDKKISEDNINIDFMKKIIQFCNKNNSKFIFLSSLAAQKNVNRYSFIKRECESIALSYSKSIIIRSSMVTSDNGGLINKLNNLFKFLPFLLLPGKSNYPTYTIDLKNLSSFLLKLQNSTNFQTIINAYDIGPIEFKKLLNSKGKITLTIPISLIKAPLFLIELFKVNLRSFSIDGINTLINMELVDENYINYKELKIGN